MLWPATDCSNRVSQHDFSWLLLPEQGRGRPFCHSSRQWVVASNICPVSTLKEFSNYSSKAFLLYFYTHSADIPDCNDFSLGATVVPALTKE